MDIEPFIYDQPFFYMTLKCNKEHKNWPQSIFKISDYRNNWVGKTVPVGVLRKEFNKGAVWGGGEGIEVPTSKYRKYIDSSQSIPSLI